MAFRIERVKHMLRDKKITYDKVCADLGITKQTLINYFNEKTKMDVVTLEKIAKMVDTPVMFFFDENDKIMSEPMVSFKPTQKVFEQKFNAIEKELKEIKKLLKK